jgi:arylsulfatase A-like enzyme
MSAKCFYKVLCIGLLTLLVTACDNVTNEQTNQSVQPKADERPNVIFIYTDDHGYADVGAHKVRQDVKTPNIDDIAANGVRMTAGYVTAPQCTPSRAGLMSGRYQQTFGLDDNLNSPFPLSQPTLAERLQVAGYETGMIGKWHLNINRLSKRWFSKNYPNLDAEQFSVSDLPAEVRNRYMPANRGFDKVFNGNRIGYRTNFTLQGEPKPLGHIVDRRFRIDVTSDAAVSFIKQQSNKPFFLYLAYFAPHVPLEASQKYLDRFPQVMPQRRRYALAMISAMDDGVGRIMEALKQSNKYENTIVFFISDNGAPLSLTAADLPIEDRRSGWDGSYNDPWVGEKGMLTEGALRVPYMVQWPSKLAAGKVYTQPVLSLDASTTAAALAGVSLEEFDGINLIPLLTSEQSKPSERALYWRFWNQAAIRKGKWKYLMNGSGQEYLFDLEADAHENNNLFTERQNISNKLRGELGVWSETLKRPGLPTRGINNQEQAWYKHYLAQ